MARYTIRIELHDATSGDYAEMYRHLAGQGIDDVLLADDGRRYRLPPGEYGYRGSASRREVFDRARAAAAKVVAAYAVLVTESGGRIAYGLEELDPP